MQNTTTTGDFDLEAFALHCWRHPHQALESIFSTMIATAPNVDLPALRQQVADAMLERANTSDRHRLMPPPPPCTSQGGALSWEAATQHWTPLPCSAPGSHPVDASAST